jgi:hypothetical protein
LSLRIYFDEDFASDTHANVLIEYRHDVLRPHDVGLLGHSDEEHLVFATSVERLLISYNPHDFLRIHTEWMNDGRKHAGILLVHKVDQYSPGELLRRLLLLEQTFPSGTNNQILFLSNFG